MLNSATLDWLPACTPPPINTNQPSRSLDLVAVGGEEESCVGERARTAESDRVFWERHDGIMHLLNGMSRILAVIIAPFIERL